MMGQYFGFDRAMSRKLENRQTRRKNQNKVNANDESYALAA